MARKVVLEQEMASRMEGMQSPVTELKSPNTNQFKEFQTSEKKAYQNESNNAFATLSRDTETA